MKDQKYFQMRSKARSKCKVKKMKDCMIKSLRKQRKWKTRRQKKLCKLCRRTTCGDIRMKEMKQEDCTAPGKWEMTWEPPRKKLDWPVREEARSGEESTWRMEPEGEADYKDFNGKGHHGQGKAKNQVKESRWMEEIPQRCKQPGGTDWTEVRTSFCGSIQQSGSSCWRRRRSSCVHPRKRRKNCPGMGQCAWRGCECLQHSSGIRRDGPQEMKLSWKQF